MKKVAVLLVCVLFGLKCLMANPIPLPFVEINELMFDSEKGWMLELCCLGSSEYCFEKITISSSSGSAESKYLPVWEGQWEYEQIFILTSDSMESELEIGHLGDKISVEVMFFYRQYENPSYYEDSFIIYGNFSGSKIAAPFEGQSIGYFRNENSWNHSVYAKTNEPTMGNHNNLQKMYGTLTGKVYNKNKQLVVNDSISFANLIEPYYNNTYKYIDETGSYSIRLLANRFSKSHVYMADKKVKIKPFTIDIEPDSIMKQDIYLLEDYTAINETNNSTKFNDFPVRIYPNPLSGGQVLQYEVGTPVKSLDCRMELVSMDGKVIFESKITDYSGSINLPQTLTNGIYIVNFKLNNKTYFSTSLIISK